jgi:SAM-dependent methyltransferase
MDQQEQMQFFFEIFDSSLPRLGPGNDASTKKALNLLLSDKSRSKVAADFERLKILDIGCGNGAQTIVLASNIDGTIVAVDNHQPYLTELQRRAEAKGLSGKIQPCLRDMSDLDLEKGSFDLIWSEGALYNMGFREGLAVCHQLLTAGGLLAVSELCWLQPDPPEECRQFFASEYPAMVDIDANLATIKSCGYDLLGYFTLPESAWLETYYAPLEYRLQLFREKYAAEPERMEIIDSIQREIEIYRRHSRYYGYVFYLMQQC